MPLPVPVPGFGDVGTFWNLFSRVKAWLDRRRREKLTNAWRQTPPATVYMEVVKYYEQDRDSLFCYPETKYGIFRVPLYVRPEWTDLSTQRLTIDFKNKKRDVALDKSQVLFWEFYRELKYGRDKDLRDRDDEIFRLVDFETGENSIRLACELGQFSHACMCQYVLEHELLVSLAKKGSSGPRKLRLRDQLLPHPESVKSFAQKYTTRMGISNLVLLHKNSSEYIPMIQPRGSLSLVEQPLLDCVSSCIFSVATTPSADKDPKHTVLREIAEEIFGKDELGERTKTLNPYEFYKEPYISDLLEMMAQGTASFDITGFCIDLVRCVPEIATVLVVRDKAYYEKYYDQMKLGPEHNVGTIFAVPRKLEDVDGYLANEVVSDPDGNSKERGFDPVKWTLPAGFSFCQGLYKAVKRKLL